MLRPVCQYDKKTRRVSLILIVDTDCPFTPYEAQMPPVLVSRAVNFLEILYIGRIPL